MERGTLEVAGVERGYLLARAEAARGPLLMMLHGSGTSGRDIATVFSRLSTRGPAARVTVVFPDGWGGVWHIARPQAGEPALDDAAFLAALAGRLAGPGTPVVLAGISNGGGFAEHVARYGLLPLAGLFLVAGTLREFSRQACPVPRQKTAVTIMAGTADPLAPYYGGPLAARGVVGRTLRRRARQHGDLPAERRMVAVETVAGDWAAGNGIDGEPVVEELRRRGRRSAGDPADLGRTRLPAGGAVPDRGRRPRLARGAAGSSRPG